MAQTPSIETFRFENGVVEGLSNGLEVRLTRVPNESFETHLGYQCKFTAPVLMEERGEKRTLIAIRGEKRYVLETDKPAWFENGYWPDRQRPIYINTASQYNAAWHSLEASAMMTNDADMFGDIVKWNRKNIATHAQILKDMGVECMNDLGADIPNPVLTAGDIHNITMGSLGKQITTDTPASPRKPVPHPPRRPAHQHP